MDVLIKLELPPDLQQFKLPPGLDDRLQELLNRQDSGETLTTSERQEAEGLVDIAEMLSLLGLRAQRAASENRVLPRNFWEESVESAFRQVLSMPDGVDIHQSFFHLGGDSLLTIRLRSILENTMNVAVRITDIFQAPSVAELADLLAKRELEGSPKEALEDAAEPEKPGDDERLPADQ